LAPAAQLAHAVQEQQLRGAGALGAVEQHVVVARHRHREGLAQRRQEGFLRLREQRGIGGLQAVELGLGWTHARGAPARRRRTLRMGGGSLPLLHRTSCFREATVIGSAIRGWRSGTLTAVAAPACGAAPTPPARPCLPRRLTYNSMTSATYAAAAARSPCPLSPAWRRWTSAVPSRPCNWASPVPTRPPCCACWHRRHGYPTTASWSRS